MRINGVQQDVEHDARRRGLLIDQVLQLGTVPRAPGKNIELARLPAELQFQLVPHGYPVRANSG